MAQDPKVEIQVKFAFYLVSLVFTLLAASVQTAEFGDSGVADFAELAGWFLLFASGLCGLRRIEMMPKVYRLGELENQYGPATEAGKIATKKLERKQALALTCYRTHKTLFVFGLASVLVSRGWLAFIELI